MAQPSFEFALGRISVLSTHLLSASQLRRIAEAGSTKEAQKLLLETGYGENAATAAVENTAGEENRQEKQDTDSQNSGSSGTVSESGSDTNSSAGGSSGSDSGSAGQPAEERTEAAPKPTEAPRMPS